MRKSICALLAMPAMAVGTPAHAAENPYSPPRVIDAMRAGNPKLKIIIAHRGLYGPECPENSECAIDRAIANGAEAVEIDVKETKDGVPWPSHDITVGRGTTYTVNGVFFNPFARDAANERNNPLISDLTARELEHRQLRDINGHVTPLVNVSLQGLLNYSRTKHNNIVYVFDIKYPQSVKKVAQMVKAMGIDNASVLKFSATFFNPLEVFQQTLGVAFAPTLYAPQMDDIADRYFLQKPDYNDRVYTYMRDFSFVKGFTYYELGNKMFVMNGQSADVTGPMAGVTHRLVADRHPIGNFIPVIEHRPDERSPETGFYHTDGHCCTRLIDFLAKTKHFGDELRDDRISMPIQVRFNEVVITDDYLGARTQAINIGSRQDEPTLINRSSR